MSSQETASRVSAFADDAMGSDDVTGLLARLALREVSAAELRAAAVERARTANEALNAVTTWVDAPVAPEGAAAADAPFAGIPTLVKDNEDLAGYATSHGSRAIEDRPAASHSPWVDQYLRLGFAPIAKTALPEFGLTASTESSRFGATRNPWDTGRSAGGSSGGSAALLAAGVVPIAHANDGGGSIRIPASCCGLVGLKPSRGRLVDRPELARLPVALTTQGVLTRSVRDTARYYAEAERLHAAPGLPAIGHVKGPGGERLRVALVVDGLRGLPVESATVAAVREAGALLAGLGHHVEEAELPVDDRFGTDFLRYWAFLSFALQNAGGYVLGAGFDRSRTESLTQELSAMFGRGAFAHPGSLRRLRRMAREHAAAFDTFDLVVSPVTGHPAPPIGHLGPDVEARAHLVRLLRFASFTAVQNISGAPAISLPLGRTGDGRPIGVQLAAPYGLERRLLEVAYEVEAAAPWPTDPAAV
jgi:amidase